MAGTTRGEGFCSLVSPGSSHGVWDVFRHTDGSPAPPFPKRSGRAILLPVCGLLLTPASGYPLLVASLFLSDVLFGGGKVVYSLHYDRRRLWDTFWTDCRHALPALCVGALVLLTTYLLMRWSTPLGDTAEVSGLAGGPRDAGRHGDRGISGGSVGPRGNQRFASPREEAEYHELRSCDELPPSD